jgi:8-oxo-dGTP diphosphatase
MIEVVCALIEHRNKVLVTQRSLQMSQPGLWEFPGGKREVGESAEEALIREIAEELHMRIKPIRFLGSFTHHYPEKTVCLLAYTCRWTGSELKLEEHAEARWLHPRELKQLNWCPADLPILEVYLQHKMR